MMSQYQQKTAANANFNGGHIPPHYNANQLENLSNKNLSADNNESDDGKLIFVLKFVQPSQSAAQKMMWTEETSNANIATRRILAIPPSTLT